jgi:hypothetical protein
LANLDAYIDFSVRLEKSPTASAMVLTDPDDYPAGVDTTLVGYFVITQPDTITITGSFASPDIEWDGSALTTATKELRLRATGGFQQGTYTIEYHVEAAGYDETVLTKTFSLSYNSPTLTVTDNFDVFTPDLSVTDDTVYTQSGFTLDGVTRAWEATIISVEGTNQDISGSSATFDLAYLGGYYDSQYDVSLTATANYTLAAPSDFVTIEDEQEFEETYYAFIPPTLIELLEMLTEYKETVDAGSCICGSGCASNCDTLIQTYSLAVSIYTHIVERGREGETEGLDAYVLQLKKLLNNCVTIAYENTDEAIPAYEWGGGGSAGVFAFETQMIVGSGVNNAPANGATTYTDTDLIGKRVLVVVDSLILGVGLADRFSYTYVMATGVITWNMPLFTGQLIVIYTY